MTGAHIATKKKYGRERKREWQYPEGFTGEKPMRLMNFKILTDNTNTKDPQTCNLLPVFR